MVRHTLHSVALDELEDALDQRLVTHVDVRVRQLPSQQVIEATPKLLDVLDDLTGGLEPAHTRNHKYTAIEKIRTMVAIGVPYKGCHGTKEPRDILRPTELMMVLFVKFISLKGGSN